MVGPGSARPSRPPRTVHWKAGSMTVRINGTGGARSFEAFEREVQRVTDQLSAEARRERGGGPAGSPRLPSPLSRLYEANRSAAVRRILEGPPLPCPVPLEDLRRHFSFDRDDARGGAPRPEPLPPLPRLASPPDGLGRPFTPGEVRAALRRAKNSSPGEDEIPNDLLKRWDREGQALADIFERCRRFRRTPARWKRARTIFAYKRGDPADPSNWRPLALCNTVYKVYAKCLAGRVSRWAREGGALHPQQKGFQGQEGVREHRFLLRSVLHLARSAGRECAVAWLDLADAYGSIPPCHVFETLAEFGMPEDFLGLLRELCDGWTTAIKAGREAVTIPLRTGLKQGCPLSAVMFHLAIEPLLRLVDGPSRGFSLYGTRVGVLAYADDLVLVAESAGELQAMLDDATAAADWIGLRFKAGKCTSLHCRGGACRATEFRVQGEALSCLAEGETVPYLGMPIGFREQPGTLADDFEASVDKIQRSRLINRQKVNLLKETLLPRGLPTLGEEPVPNKVILRIDSVIRSALSRWDPYNRSAGVLAMEELRDIEVVTHAFVLLSSPDEVVKAVARGALQATVHESCGWDPTGKDLASYLSGFREDWDHHRNGTSASLWSRARYATRRLDRRIGCQWIYTGELRLEHRGKIMGRKTLARTLKSAVSDCYAY